MGGMSIFRVKSGEPNTNVIFETLTDSGMRYAMAQRFVPEIAEGDKRVLLIEGEPMPFALAARAGGPTTRGAISRRGAARGAHRDRRGANARIARAVGPVAREKGLMFVGLGRESGTTSPRST